jgi:hypothetical protein
MGETTNQIENYIDNKREDLGSNLKELEGKVKSIADWRQQFQKNPMTLVCVAFGGGVLLASMIGGKSRQKDRRAANETRPPHAGTDQQTRKALETWDNIKGALIGVAATRFKDFVGEIVPGFQEQFHNAEQATSSSGQTAMTSSLLH